jgi:hypothetical protein
MTKGEYKESEEITPTKYFVTLPLIESILEINEWYCSSKNSCRIKMRKNTSVYATKNSLKPLRKRRKL